MYFRFCDDVIFTHAKSKCAESETTRMFCRDHQEMALWAKSAVFECMLFHNTTIDIAQSKLDDHTRHL